MRCLSALLSVAGALAGCAAPGAAIRSGGPDARSLLVTPAEFRSATGCTVGTTRYLPGHPRTGVTLVLAPGFMRSRAQLSGLAEALAAQGIPVVTLDPCNTHPWGNRPVANARDMIEAARRAGAPEAVYGGFSAGGLTALIAARLDPGARGVLALDLVDQRGLGAGMARGLRLPLVGLVGKPAGCNAYGNGVPALKAAPHGRFTRVPGASHCDFESPTDWLCETVCTGGAPGAPARRQSIVATATAAATLLVGLNGPTFD